MENNLNGLLNVLKPPGMTSHDVVNRLRQILQTKKIGHAGTLDPGAAGVLPIAVGKAARFIEYFIDAGKSYRAESLFGIATDSGDDTGEVIEKAADGWIFPREEKIIAALSQLTGEISQIPPVYSAIKIKGKRASDLARKNTDVIIPPRLVTINRLALLAINETTKTILIDIDCSKGTYIRSLCRDIGKILGLPATMSFLVRTRAGNFFLKDAYTLEEITALYENGNLSLQNVGENLAHLPRYQLPPSRRKPFYNGLPTTAKNLAAADGMIFTVFTDGEFIGIGRFQAKDNAVYPVKLYLP